MAYSDKVLEYNQKLDNASNLDPKNPNVGTALVGAPACGDVMRLQIEVAADGIISKARFKTYGCGSAIASSALVTEWLEGKTLDEAEKIQNREIADALDLPPIKRHCSVLAQEAIQGAIQNYKEKHQAAKTALSESRDDA